MRSGRGPFGGLIRLFDRRRPLVPPPRRGMFGDLPGSSRLGSPLGYGRDRAFRMVLIAVAILLVGIYLGRHWGELF